MWQMKVGKVSLSDENSSFSPEYISKKKNKLLVLLHCISFYVFLCRYMVLKKKKTKINSNN